MGLKYSRQIQSDPDPNPTKVYFTIVVVFLVPSVEGQKFVSVSGGGIGGIAQPMAAGGKAILKLT
jgi:hypothetical protein